MPDRSPLTSARNTGTPSRAKPSARTCSEMVLPVPVAPAISPCRLAMRGERPRSLAAAGSRPIRIESLILNEGRVLDRRAAGFLDRLLLGACGAERTLLLELLDPRRADLALGVRHHLEEAALAADQRDDAVEAREAPAVVGRLLAHHLAFVGVLLEHHLIGDDELLDEV